MSSMNEISHFIKEIEQMKIILEGFVKHIVSKPSLDNTDTEQLISTVSTLLKTIEKATLELQKVRKVTEEKIRLDAKIKELEKSDQLRAELLSIVKHEFKTPLMPIKGYCEILQEQSNENLTKDQQHALNRIYQNVNKFDQVLDKILDIYSLETNLLFFHEEIISVHDFMTDVASDFSNKITQSGMEFITTNIDEAEIKGDKSKLKQVFEHIINNAKSFSMPETGKIEIGAKVDEEMVIFYVKNNGSVIPKAEQQNIFKKFYQVDSSKTRRHQGMGLGLAICKEIIEKLDGKIWCESEEGKGTTFYFSILRYKEKITMEPSHQ